MTRRIAVAFAMQPAELRDQLFTPAALQRLAEVATFDPALVLGSLADDGALAAVADVEVLITGWGAFELDAEALAAMPRLRAVAHAAGSVKHHLPPVFWERGISVSSAADANSLPVAEYTLAAILFANKGVLATADAYRRNPAGIDLLADFPTIGNYNKRVGIIGASRIGRRVIELLRPFGLEVAVYDPYLDAAEAKVLGVALVGLDELVASSDVVSIHAPALPATHHLLDERRLGLMRDGATLINTARGSLVDHDALVAELETGRIHAVLDVTEPERLPAESPLFRLPNVLLTPHMAGSLGTELARLGDTAVDEVARVAAGLPLRHPVCPEQLDRTA